MATEFSRPRRQRRVTMADVARAAGISTALVSIVMRGVPGASEATRKRVLKIADEMGYVPDQRARKLRQSSSRLLGVTFELQQPFHGDLVEQIYAAAAGHGYDVTLSAVAPSRDESTAVGALLRERCEAAILLGSRLAREELPGWHAGGRRCWSPGGPTSRARRRAQRRQGRDRARRRPPRRPRASAHRAHQRWRRTRSIRTCHRVHHPNGTSRPSRLALLLPGGPTETDGAQAITEALLFDHQPTAVVAFNDRCAIGVLEVLRQRGVHVPEDVSVIGYDDSRLSRLSHISMSTIAQDVSRIATETMASVTAQLAGNTPTQTVSAPRLIARDTTGPAPSVPRVSKPGAPQM